MTTAVEPTAVPVLELDDISMRFGAVDALSSITFTVRAGEVLGLIGDNGAGKSTLIKIITGYYQPTRGTLSFLGKQRRFRTPAHARRLGIETVYQDLAIAEDLSLWRNFFLGKELTKGVGPLRVMRRREMRRICGEQMAALGLTRGRSPDSIAKTLSGGERQSLAITRAVHFGARLLLLDEPTAALSVRETQRVFAAIRAARDRGMAVIYIDHNMAHVQPVADRIAVIEHGRLAAILQAQTATAEQLAAMLSKMPTEAPVSGVQR